MPTDHPLTVRCPSCDHVGARLIVQSAMVIMVTCSECAHIWATDWRTLPEEVQQTVRALTP